MNKGKRREDFWDEYMWIPYPSEDCPSVYHKNHPLAKEHIRNERRKEKRGC